MVSIDIKGVTKSFGTTKAVDDISLRIEPGELFFLLGPSGCGKTTLLRLLAGFYHPEPGRLFFGDKDITDVPPHKRNTGMVFQNYALWPHMTVRQNLAFGLEMRGVAAGDKDERIDRTLEMVQMAQYADRSPNQLSGGQQQRVALARALVLEPDVVLMDEPLSNLDAKLRLEMREHIKRIHASLGLTMVYVTHDQIEALSMADRMAVMHQGGICQIGSPREIYNRPNSRFVADFIGEANIVKGKIKSIEAGMIAVETASGVILSSVPCKGAKAGDEVSCCIRPERLHLLVDSKARKNVFEGTVERIIYLGSQEQYFLRLASGAAIKGIEYGIERRPVEEGGAARLGCDPGDVVALKN